MDKWEVLFADDTVREIYFPPGLSAKDVVSSLVSVGTRAAIAARVLHRQSSGVFHQFSLSKNTTNE